MRIGELAKRTGVTRDTIRYYERCGLIRSAPSRSATNSYRIYDDDAALTLGLIAEAQAAGMALDDVRALVDVISVGSDIEHDVMAFIDTKITEVEETIARSTRFLETLKATRAALIAGPPAEEFDWPSSEK